MITARPLLLLITLATLAAAACAPMPYKFLKPSMHGAEYTRSVCGENYGPKDRVVFHGPKDIIIRVSGFLLEDLSHVQHVNNEIAIKQNRKPPYPSISHERGIGIAILLQIPQSISVQFLSRSFLLTDEESQAVYEYQADQLLLLAKPTVNLSALSATLASLCSGDCAPKSHIGLSESLAAPPKAKWFGLTIDRPYYIVLLFEKIENARSGQFRLRIPPLSVGAVTYEFPEIDFHFVREWQWGWLALNC